MKFTKLILILMMAFFISHCSSQKNSSSAIAKSPYYLNTPKDIKAFYGAEGFDVYLFKDFVII